MFDLGQGRVDCVEDDYFDLDAGICIQERAFVDIFPVSQNTAYFKFEP